jgi:thioredoxin-related protein
MKMLSKNLLHYSLGTCLIVLLVLVFTNQKPKPEPIKVNWLTYEQAQKLNAQKPRKIFIDTYTDWCGWCKKMDANTLSHPEVAKYLNEKFYAVKLNAESSKLTIYKGKSITERELATKIFGANSFPTTVYLDEKENILQPLPGYLEVAEFDKIIHFFGEDYYTKTDWKTFESIYKKE